MSRLSGYYDRFAERKGFSLRVAFAYTSTYAVLIGIGLVQLWALDNNRGDSFYLYMAPLSLVVGMIGLFQGVQVIRAVRRQKGSDAHPSPRG
jgi:hypothetical protein